MNILFLTNRTFLPQSIGGAEWSTHHLCLQLRDLGHDVAVLCSLHPKGRLAFWNRIQRKVFRRRFPRDRGLGYRVFRSWDPLASLDGLATLLRPDIAVVIGAPPDAVSLAMKCLTLKLRTVYQVRDVVFQKHGDLTKIKNEAHFIANSQFTAERLRDQFGISSDIIIPTIIPEQVQTDGHGSKILLINPDPDKGGQLLLQLARARSKYKYLIQESWKGNAQLIEAKQIAMSLGNVEWRAPTQDIREAFREARILIVPSRVEEAWGRVVSEAQVSGIPVIASNIGGLPESVGPGGLLIDPSSGIERWTEAVDSLMLDEQRWNAVSEAARLHARRPEMDVRYQARQVQAVFDEFVKTP